MVHPFAKYRKKLGISKAELGRRLGLARSFICDIEAGRRRLAADRVAVVSKITGIAPEKLRPDVFKVAA